MTPKSTPVRFGIFEFNSESGELRKSGILIKLHDQPARVLAILVSRPGEIVNREELHQALWSADSLVDFDVGLNTAIKKIRQSLGDLADSPRFVETIPRVGYRFLAELIQPHAEPAPPIAPPEPKSRRWWIAGVALAIAIFAGGWFAVRQQRPAPVVRFTIPLPAGQSLRSVASRQVAVSPDGCTIVYSAQHNSATQLFRRALDEYEPRVILGTEGAQAPAYSQDGRRIAFYSGGKLKTVDLESQAVRSITDATADFRIVWAADDAIYYCFRPEGHLKGIWRIRPGKQPERILEESVTPAGSEYLALQDVLPGGDVLLYTRVRSPLDRSLHALTMSTGADRLLLPHAMEGLYLPSGHLLYYWRNSIMAIRFDSRRLEVSGVGVPVLNGVQGLAWGYASMNVSRNGTVAWIRSAPPENRTLVWVDHEGKESPLPAPPGPYDPLDVSPDGNQILAARYDSPGEWGLWIYDLRAGSWKKLIDGQHPRTGAIWSPDGRSVIASTEKHDGEFVNLYRVPLDRPDQAQRLLTDPHYGQFPTSASKNAGGFLYAAGSYVERGVDLFFSPFSGGTPTPIATTEANEENASFSPDGKWIAYDAGPLNNSYDLYVRPFPSGAPVRITTDGGRGPLWSPVDDEIYYRRNNELMAISWKDGRAGTPRVLFKGPYSAPDLWGRRFAISPDGKRFLLVKQSPEAFEPREIHVIVNWFEELKSL